MNPTVTVIALSYNHVAFLSEAINSLLDQTYPSIEIIAIDDASTDASVGILEAFAAKGVLTLISNKENRGNCASFNQALKRASGKYIIDFSTDDVLLPEMVEKMVEKFESVGEDYGLVFGDCMYIDEAGTFIKTHYKRDKEGIIAEEVPEGAVYADAVKRYFIPAPAVMLRKSMLKELGGYDEALSYEDFDLWVRAARNYKFCFLNRLVIKKRLHPRALSVNFYNRKNKLQESTFRVCEKILWLNKNKEEDKALTKRVKYEMRQAYFTGSTILVLKYIRLLKHLEPLKWQYVFFGILSKAGISGYFPFSVYLRIRKNIK